MPNTTGFSTIHRLIRRWNGSTLEWDLSAYKETVTKIREREDAFNRLSDDELTAHAAGLRDDIRSGTAAGTLLVPVYALTGIAIRRILHLDPFDEQIVAGIVMHRGKCAQMQTGEGKTLAAVYPAVLNALGGRGVHILTFNDYLAERDAQWMGPVYRLLGLSTGFVREGMTIDERKSAYRCAVTYLTAREAGFDYLRDHCCYDISHTVQRAFHYAIVDEADSILIDEARIPLVIATLESTGDEHTAVFARLARDMQPDRHFTFDAYGRKIALTDDGTDFAEEKLRCGNLFTPENGHLLTSLYHALHAEYLLHPDVDYLVRNDRIEIIDELTGRVPHNRRWPDGLHTAVEAREGCPVQPRGAVRGSITMHHFIGLYPKTAGMTATAESAEEELHDWYGLDTVIIPPHLPCIRFDHSDRVFATHREKTAALIKEITGTHATGRPVLVGTRTVRESEELAGALKDAGISCRVLNAKDNAVEAAIIAEAGIKGAVTISTNMAGRGTDIRLGGPDGKGHAEVAALGGLYVIGTNRFESRRIDDQLRGRSGRQGDPGSSRFFISLEDKLFVKYHLDELIPKQFIIAEENGRIESTYVNNEVNRLQRIIEGQDADIKFTLGKYASLTEQQRRIVAEYRRAVLHANDIPPVFASVADGSHGTSITVPHLERCRSLLLAALDRQWSLYLADMADIREGIHLRRFGRQDPLHEFNTLAIERFAAVIATAEREAVDEYTREAAADGSSCSAGTPPLHPSATWTYTVSDNPFEDDPDLQLSGNMGYSLFAGLLWPVTMLMLLVKRKKRKGVMTDGTFTR